MDVQRNLLTKLKIKKRANVFFPIKNVVPAFSRKTNFYPSTAGEAQKRIKINKRKSLPNIIISSLTQP